VRRTSIRGESLEDIIVVVDGVEITLDFGELWSSASSVQRQVWTINRRVKTRLALDGYGLEMDSHEMWGERGERG
jgi:hypothetical protein